MKENRIALVTGSNKGLGLETAKELARKGIRTILTARDEAKGKKAFDDLRREDLPVEFHVLDVSNEASRVEIHRWVAEKFSRLDILVNNAGVFLDASQTPGGNTSALKVGLDTIQKTLEINTFGPFRMCQLFIPLMKKNDYGRIVNVSSGMAQLSEMDGGYPAYRISKTALNAVTKVFAAETEGSGILVNSVCPGWVKTDMGGAGAERSISEGADTIVWAATLPIAGPSGTFFRDHEKIEW